MVRFWVSYNTDKVRTIHTRLDPSQTRLLDQSIEVRIIHAFRFRCALVDLGAVQIDHSSL